MQRRSWTITWTSDDIKMAHIDNNCLLCPHRNHNGLLTSRCPHSDPHINPVDIQVSTEETEWTPKGQMDTHTFIGVPIKTTTNSQRSKGQEQTPQRQRWTNRCLHRTIWMHKCPHKDKDGLPGVHESQVSTQTH